MGDTIARGGMPWQTLGLLMAVAMVVSSIGFFRMVYFISVGYAFSIVAMVAALVIIARGQFTWLSLVQNALLLLWGLRLGVFLVQREWRQKSYREQAESMHGAAAGTQVGIRIAIWLTVSLLYVALFAPSLFAATGYATAWASAVQAVGAALMAVGVLLEAVADAQKSAAKQIAPRAFVQTGLYRWVRCPNYLGEMLFWTGNFVAGIGFYRLLGHWLLCTVGVVCLILIMLGSTRRIEQAQDVRYGEQADYQRYVRTTPIVFPFVPLYTLRNLRVYLG